MELPGATADLAGLSGLPPLPQRGLDEVLRSWSGQGQLWAALAACRDPVAERQWTPADVRARAHRILFARLEPHLARWPVDRWQWLDAIPPAVTRARVHSAHPVPGADWPMTRRLGWPPRRFVGRPPRRHDDELLVQVLRWVLGKLAVVYADSVPSGSPEFARASLACEVALGLLKEPALADVEPARPGFGDLRGIGATGAPWAELASAAAELLVLDDPDLSRLAWQAVAPDPSLAWRLFHLAVLGEVLHALRTSGARVTSLRPLGAALPGPAFAVRDAAGEEWDLWFEAAGAWRHYERREPYPLVAAGVEDAGSALGSDLMLIQAGRRALLLECKYSFSGRVVARGGYMQALAYAAEANELCPAITSVVVGPVGVVESPGWAHAVPGLLGMISPEQLPELIEHCLKDD